jgi:cytidylate kinase
MVVAIFGICCVGKTSIATNLAQRMRCTVRHCGELVNVRANELGTEAQRLDIRDHQAIDRETLSTARSGSSPVIIEGCFLDLVIGQVPGVYFVRLTCSDEERKRRFDRSRSANAADLWRRDEQDSILREKLYGSSNPAEADMTIDTTSLSPDEAAENILTRLNAVGKKNDPT